MSRAEGIARPDPTQADAAAHRTNREQRERYAEFWDCGDEHDAELDPTRPADRDLLPREAA